MPPYTHSNGGGEEGGEWVMAMCSWAMHEETMHNECLCTKQGKCFAGDG